MEREREKEKNKRYMKVVQDLRILIFEFEK